jgi:hypothetical protein
MDASASSSSRSSSSASRTPRGGGGVVIGSPSSAPTRLLRLKKEPGLGASSARVKKMSGTPTSFTRVKKEHGAPVPPSSKKARRLANEAVGQLDYQASDDPEEFPSLRTTEVESFRSSRKP